MLIIENFIVALQALWANKLRSALTTLGIIIGVTAVIAVVSIIQGLSKYITDFFQEMGSNVIWVVPHRPTGKEGKKLGRIRLTLEDGDAISKKCPSVKSVSPLSYQGVSLRYGDSTVETTLYGVSLDYQESSNYYVEAGRFFTFADMIHRKNVCVLGADVLDNLNTDESIIGKFIKLNNRNFRVIGVMEKRGSFFGETQDDRVIVPLRTVEKLFGKTKMEYLIFVVHAKSEDLVESAKDEIKELLRKRHKLEGNMPNDFRLATHDQILKEFKKTSAVLTGVVSGIVGISLLVGGIGIMNIMLVSVTERTREIGVRKALGARTKDILFQFLVEAVSLSLFGGTLGILIGFFLGIASTPVLGHYLGFEMPPAHIPAWAVALGFGFSVCVGIFFGIYPAMKAARLDPIEALRYE